ncbi:MAG: hypothetical protein OEM02_11290, partial [Desulfobulbaceae bacterium]|nr:hypothetical protein [Desulfobulbaceae bacterium]
SRCYFLRRSVKHHCQRELALLHPSYWLMRQTKTLSPACLLLFRRVCAGYCQPLLGNGPYRGYLCNLCISAWTLALRCFLGALTRYFPKNIGLTLDLRRSAHPDSPCKATSTRHVFSELQLSSNVQAPILARPQIAPTAEKNMGLSGSSVTKDSTPQANTTGNTPLGA